MTVRRARIAFVIAALCLAAAGTRPAAADWSVIGPDGGAISTAPVHDPVTPTVVYAGTANGVVRSVDGGASWSRTGLFGRVRSLAIDPVTPSIIFASCTGPVFYGAFVPATGDVFKSTDSGTTWAPVLDTNPFDDVETLAIDPVTPSTVYAGGRAGVRKTTDGGATWAPMSAGLGNAEVRRSRSTRRRRRR